METADRSVEVLLTSTTTDVLRVILNQEIARIERWVLVHGSNAVSTVLRDVRNYLAQVRLLQGQVEASRGAAVCDGAARVLWMSGERGGRLSKRQTTALRSISG